jgi:hypothetical protein
MTAKLHHYNCPQLQHRPPLHNRPRLQHRPPLHRDDGSPPSPLERAIADLSPPLQQRTVGGAQRQVEFLARDLRPRDSVELPSLRSDAPGASREMTR